MSILLNPASVSSVLYRGEALMVPVPLRRWASPILSAGRADGENPAAKGGGATAAAGGLSKSKGKTVPLALEVIWNHLGPAATSCC